MPSACNRTNHLVLGANVPGSDAERIWFIITKLISILLWFRPSWEPSTPQPLSHSRKDKIREKGLKSGQRTQRAHFTHYGHRVKHRGSKINWISTTKPLPNHQSNQSRTVRKTQDIHTSSPHPSLLSQALLCCLLPHHTVQGQPEDGCHS